MKRALRVKIAIATAGRVEMLSRTLRQIEHQTLLPDEVLVCPARDGDCDRAMLSRLRYPAREVRSEAVGLCAQRNALLRQLGECDVVVFLDDDFYPSPNYLERVSLLFSARPDVVGATGWVIADGSINAGVHHETAIRLLEEERVSGRDRGLHLQTAYALYGCNMAMRVRAIQDAGLSFDEALPLYGWLEDIDFSRQLSAQGRLVQSRSLRGVHLAEKRGRSRGVPLGYSQIANPLYMLRKGTLNARVAARQVSRNVAANVWRSLRPEPWVDRRGRLHGNVLAAAHLLFGRLDPRNVVAL